MAHGDNVTVGILQLAVGRIALARAAHRAVEVGDVEPDLCERLVLGLVVLGRLVVDGVGLEARYAGRLGEVAVYDHVVGLARVDAGVGRRDVAGGVVRALVRDARVHGVAGVGGAAPVAQGVDGPLLGGGVVVDVLLAGDRRERRAADGPLDEEELAVLAFSGAPRLARGMGEQKLGRVGAALGARRVVVHDNRREPRAS